MTSQSPLTAYPKDKIALREVGLRDGLQLTQSFPTTAAKMNWIEREYAAGIRHFEVGSFLPAARFPQFADVQKVIDVVTALPDARAIGLVVNERGARDAVETGLDEITVVLSATEAHNMANAKRSRDQSLTEIAKTVALRDASESDALINVGIAMAFGCSLSGDVAIDDVIAMVDRALDAGADMVGIADTVGFAGPRQVDALCQRMTKLLGDAPYVVHLHDTRGMGIANASAALSAVARVFDASLGGLGGCPFAPGATGNVVLEDMVYLLETSGYGTGIDLNALIKIRDIPGTQMPDDPLYGALARSGPPEIYTWRKT